MTDHVLIRERCHIFPCILILLLQIKHGAQHTVFLWYVQHRHCLFCHCWYPPPCCGVSLYFLSEFRVKHFWHLGRLCLSCFDSLIKRNLCITLQIGGNFNGSGPSRSLYFSLISSHSWGLSEHAYLLSSFFRPIEFWVGQFASSFLSFLLGHDFLDSQLLLSGDDLFFTLKLSQSSTNSSLGHLWHSLDSNHLRVPETLQSTSYSEPLPAGPNTTARSFHSYLLPNTPSKGCSETSTSSESNPETSLDSTSSNPNSTLTFFRDSLSHDGVRVTPAASDIKGWTIKAICDVKGRWWSGSMGNAGQWPWL